MHDDINFDWSKIEFKSQDEPIFFPSTVQVSLHGTFKTIQSINCLDPQYRIITQYQNIVYVLHGNEITQPKLRMLKGLTDGNNYGINDSQSDIIEKWIHVETDVIILNKIACKSGKPCAMTQSLIA